MAIPMRKRIIASSRIAGMDAIVALTFHDSHASMRICRTRTFSRGVPRGEFQRMYSRSHCLVRIPNRAAARLKTRLTKKRPLIHLTAVRDIDGEEATSGATVALNDAAVSTDFCEMTVENPTDRS